jgi:hypothetical protein
MNNTRFEILIQKLISNTATEQEQDELKELINDDSNLKEAERILDAHFKLPRVEAEGLTRQESSHMIKSMMVPTRPSPKMKRFKFLWRL